MSTGLSLQFKKKNRACTKNTKLSMIGKVRNQSALNVKSVTQLPSNFSRLWPPSRTLRSIAFHTKETNVQSECNDYHKLQCFRCKSNCYSTLYYQSNLSSALSFFSPTEKRKQKYAPPSKPKAIMAVVFFCFTREKV